MTDLTLWAFAYLRLPLAVAGVAFAVGRGGRLAACRPEAGATWLHWRHDGALLPCGAPGDGGLRPLHVVAGRWPRRCSMRRPES